MAGSSVRNIKFNPEKQKLVPCAACKREIVVGKFSKNGQICQECRDIPRGKDAVRPIRPVVKESFATKLSEMAVKLGYTVNDKRIWRKKYAIDGGGVAVIHLMIDPGIAGSGQKLDYFSITIQRAVMTSENFRDFMPPEAASDCEVLADAFGDKLLNKHEIGKEKCDKRL